MKEEDLAATVTDITEFVSRTGLVLVPAVPEPGEGPVVFLEPEKLDLSDFLAMASKLGGGVLYLQAAPFVLEDDDTDRTHGGIARYEGRIGQVIAAFAVNGLVHYWEAATTWYAETQELAGNRLPRPVHGYAAPVFRDKDEERRVGELADLILADPRFRAMRPGPQQDLVARQILPADTPDIVRFRAIGQARFQAADMAQESYAVILGKLDELASELLTTPEYQNASSAGARKQVAERFLIGRADGFIPPAYVRDELYAQAQRLAKAGTAKGKGL